MSTSENHEESKQYEVDRVAEFDRQMKTFVKKKKFFSLPGQIEELIEKFEKGEFNGDRIAHCDSPISYDIYKVRLPNPDADAGKSGGYRVLYLVVTEAKIVVLLTIFYKKELPDVTDTYIQWLIDGYFLGSLPQDEDDVDTSSNADY